MRSGMTHDDETYDERRIEALRGMLRELAQRILDLDREERLITVEVSKVSVHNDGLLFDVAGAVVFAIYPLPALLDPAFRAEIAAEVASAQRTPDNVRAEATA